MNIFDKQSVKRAAWKAAKNPESGSLGWLIAGVVIILVILKVILNL